MINPDELIFFLLDTKKLLLSTSEANLFLSAKLHLKILGMVVEVGGGGGGGGVYDYNIIMITFQFGLVWPKSL